MLPPDTYLNKRYRILHNIGRGGFGYVYKAIDQNFGCCVAIKETREDKVVTTELKKAFEREAQLLRSLKHKCLPRVTDYFFNDQSQFLVMDFIEGDDLATMLDRRLASDRAFTVGEVLPWADSLLDALEYLHGLPDPIIHRDIKPLNIKLANDGIYLLDFGLAKGTTGQMSTVINGQSSFSIAGGTPNYAPLEQLQGPGTKPQTDVYSLGATLYHLLTGHPPINSSIRDEAIQRDLADPLKRVHEANPAITIAISRVIEHAMMIRWWDRLASAKEMRAALTLASGNLVNTALSQDPSARYQSASEFAEALKKIRDPASQVQNEVTALQPQWLPSHSMPAVNLMPIIQPGVTSNSSTAGSKARSIVSPPASRFQLHIDFLNSPTAQSSYGKQESTPVRPDEQWEVVDQWPAFPELPTAEELQDKLELRQNFKRIGTWLAFGLTCFIVVAIKINIPEMSWLYVPFVAAFAGAIFAVQGGDTGAWLFRRLIISTSSYGERWIWPAAFDSLNTEQQVGSCSLDPRQLFWHIHGDYLFISRDHCHLTAWEWNDSWNDYWEEKGFARSASYRGPITIAQPIFSKGKIDNVFFSDYWFLAKGESPWWLGENTQHQWSIYNSWGRVEAAINGRHGDLPLFGNLQCNPWRPGHDKEILTIPGNDLLSLCDASELPKSWQVSGSDCLKIQDYAKSSLDLGLLQLSEKESIGTFAWHPSGLYLAVELAGRIDIIHWECAEKVLPKTLVHPNGGKYQAAGWSPDGKLLALDQNISQVFDVQTGRPRACEPDERWNLQVNNLETKLTSCDGLRRFSKPPYTHVELGGEKLSEQLAGVTDIAWHPRSPNLFATIGGKDCPRMVRVWKLVKSNATEV